MGLKKKVINNREKEVAANIELYKDFIEPDSILIDIGCGDGLPAFLIKNKLGLEIVCVDKDPGHFKYQNDLRFVTCDAEKLPFRDNEFETGLLFYTLHHCKNPYQVLKEAKRVIKNHLIIIEEFYKSPIHKWLMNIYDHIVNHMLYPNSDSVARFLKEEDFLKFAKNLELQIIKEHSFIKKWYRPPHKKLFIFKKSN